MKFSEFPAWGRALSSVLTAIYKATGREQAISFQARKYVSCHRPTYWHALGVKGPHRLVNDRSHAALCTRMKPPSAEFSHEILTRRMIL